MKKRLIKRLVQIFFLFLTLAALFYFDAVLCVRSDHGVDQARALYYQPENSIDVVFLGSSHIHCDIDPSVLWEQYGIAAYNYSAAEQTLWQTWHYLQEFCKYQTPRVAVLDLHAPARYRDDYQYDFLLENLCGMRPSLNKLRMIRASMEPDRYEDFLPAFATYHDRILSLTAEDFLFPFNAGREFRKFKGYTPYLRTTSQEPPHLYDNTKMAFTKKEETYLQKIAEYTDSHNILLLLIATPYPDADPDEPFFNWAGDFARDRGSTFIDFNYHADDIGLDFSQDFSDESHLNHWGAQKFTAYFGRMLDTNTDLPDHRGEPGYSSWDENIESIREFMRSA